MANEETDREYNDRVRELGTDQTILGPGAEGDLSDPEARPQPEVVDPDAEPTKAELYEQATAMGIEGRSNMTKEELQAAVTASANPTPQT